MTILAYFTLKVTDGIKYIGKGVSCFCISAIGLIDEAFKVTCFNILFFKNISDLLSYGEDTNILCTYQER